MKKNQIAYIRDDNGHAWYFSDGKIRCVLAELATTLSPEERKENGYYCDSFEEGVSLLNEYGYITGYEYDEHGSEDYFELKAHAEGG